MPDDRPDLLSTRNHNKKQLYIHTVCFKQLTESEYNKVKSKKDGDYKKRRLLFFAGWAAPSSAYAMIFKELQKHFEVTTIDMLGMGCSGRPDYYAKTIEENIEFFMLSIENWMKQTGYNEQKFNILAHSMGCYFSTNYACRHPNEIEQIMFISAAGMYGNPVDFTPKKFVNSAKTW